MVNKRTRNGELMKISSRPFLHQDNLRTIEDVQLSLEILEHDIPDTRLQLLRNFNTTYLVITRNVRQQLRKGEFEYPEFLTMFDTRFAHYYFEALRLYLTRKYPSGPWLQAFKSSERPKSSPFICMALGVNAHVNNDIPLVLRDCGATRQHYNDYLRINTIIKNSIDEVIDRLDDNRSLLHPRRPLLRPIYKPVIHLLIRLWRYNAWRKFIQLTQRATSPRRIEYQAVRTGRIIEKMNLI